MNSHKNLQKGFTLIELLVVIAIIGILSGIVITALSGARNKATESEVKSNLSGLRTAAELVYIDNDNKYDLVCDETNKNVETYLNALEDENCQPGANAYAVSAPINEEGDSWCVDSRGFTGPGTNDPAAPTQCIGVSESVDTGL